MPVFTPEKVHFRQYFIPATTITFFTPPHQRVFLLSDREGTSLRIEWDIRLTRTSSADQASFRIFNLTRGVREILHRAWKLGNTASTQLGIQCGLGWDDMPQTVFIGQIWEFLPEAHTGTDIVTVIEAGDGAVTLRDSTNTLGSSFAKQTLNLVIEYIVSNVLQVPIDPATSELILERAAELPVKSWDNYVVNGDPQDRLDELMDTLGLEWKIYRGRFIALDKGIRGTTDRPTAPVISPGTGMLAWSEQDDEGLAITALCNPKVVPGVQVAVFDANGKTIGAQRHRVTDVRFFGANYGESLMEVIARKAVLV